MHGQVIVRDDLTLAAFGYTIDSLQHGSHQFIVVECLNCGTTVRRERRNESRRHVCSAVVGTTKHCNVCHQWKDLSQFNKNGKQRGGVAKMCRVCYNNHGAVKKLEQQRSARLKSAAQDGDYRFYIKRRGPRLISRARCDGMPCDIDVAYLTKLWEDQNGKCYYTEVKMNGRGTDRGLPTWNSPSLDRLYPSLGYTKGNVVWCLNSVNSFKGQLTEAEFKAAFQQMRWKDDFFMV